METRLEGIPLLLHAIDLVIADHEERTDADREEALETLHTLRQKLLSETN